MDQTKARQRAEKPAADAWHRHPLLIAVVSAVVGLIGVVMTIVLGQSGALPTSINPAPPASTVTAVQTVTSTVTTTVTETPTPVPTGEPQSSGTPSSPPTEVPPGGALAITVGLSNGGKIGPAEYRVGSVPHAYAEVRDGSGVRQSTDCYLTWVLKRGSATILSSRSERCDNWFNFTRDSLSVRGNYHVTVSVVMEAGPTGTKTTDFKVT